MKGVLMTILCCVLGLLQAQDDFDQLSKSDFVVPHSSIAIAIGYEDMADTFQEVDLYFIAACHWMEDGKMEQAYRCLFAAANNGFKNIAWLEAESDFYILHGTLAWWELTRKIKANLAYYELSLDLKNDSPPE